MPACARREIVRQGEPGIFHCWSRTVRQAMLCGIDYTTGQDYTPRRDWMRAFQEQLAGLFAVEIAFRAGPIVDTLILLRWPLFRLDMATSTGMLGSTSRLCRFFTNGPQVLWSPYAPSFVPKPCQKRARKRQNSSPIRRFSRADSLNSNTLRRVALTLTRQTASSLRRPTVGKCQCALAQEVVRGWGLRSG